MDKGSGIPRREKEKYKKETKVKSEGDGIDEYIFGINNRDEKNVAAKQQGYFNPSLQKETQPKQHTYFLTVDKYQQVSSSFFFLSYYSPLKPSFSFSISSSTSNTSLKKDL
jgi:hypothetical protein